MYLYCIIRSREPRSFGPMGIGGRGDEVRTTHYQDLAAVISATPLVVYDPTRENAFAHEAVNQAVMREFTVLPLAFGTLFRSEADIIELMRRAYDTLSAALTRLEGKVEYGLKVSWDPSKALAEIEQESAELRRLKAKVQTQQQAGAYFAQVEFGRRVEAALQERASRYAEAILSRVGRAAVAAHSSPTVGDRMIVNASFLVERATEEAFIRTVQKTAADYEATLSVTYTGPWPAYSFARLRLQLQPGEASPAGR